MMLRRLIDTDENFRFLQECLEWVKEKLVRQQNRPTVSVVVCGILRDRGVLNGQDGLIAPV